MFGSVRSPRRLASELTRPALSVLAVLALVASIASCGGGGPGSNAGATHANVRVTSMVIGLSTTGLEWDSVSSFASHFRTDIANALLSGDPYVAATAVVTNVAADLSVALDAPDPVVSATIYVNGSIAGTVPMTTSTDLCSRMSQWWIVLSLPGNATCSSRENALLTAFGSHAPFERTSRRNAPPFRHLCG